MWLSHKVKTGDLLGEVGMTASPPDPTSILKSGWKMCENIYLRNPELWIAPLVDNGLLVGQFRNSYGWYLPARKSSQVQSHGKIINISPMPGVIQSDDYYKENVALPICRPANTASTPFSKSAGV